MKIEGHTRSQEALPAVGNPHWQRQRQRQSPASPRSRSSPSHPTRSHSKSQFGQKHSTSSRNIRMNHKLQHGHHRPGCLRGLAKASMQHEPKHPRRCHSRQCQHSSRQGQHRQSKRPAAATLRPTQASLQRWPRRPAQSLPSARLRLRRHWWSSLRAQASCRRTPRRSGAIAGAAAGRANAAGRGSAS